MEANLDNKLSIREMLPDEEKKQGVKLQEQILKLIYLLC